MTTTLRDADKSLNLFEWRIKNLEERFEILSKRVDFIERSQWQQIEREQWRYNRSNGTGPSPPATDPNQRRQNER